MPTGADDKRAADAIRARANSLVASGDATGVPVEAETLAAVIDKTMSVHRLDDDALERVVKTFGADSVSGAVMGDAAESRNIEVVTPLWRRQPVWLAAAASLVLVASAVTFLTREATNTPTVANSNPPAPADQPAPGGEPSVGVPPPAGPGPETTLALQWSPPAGNRRWSAAPAALPREMPDFERVAAGTLGPRQDRVQPWQLSTVIVRSENGWGSGAFISADGWLLTNYHVVEDEAQKAAVTSGAASLNVIMAGLVDGRVKPKPAVKARLYRADPVLDLALLKLEQPPAAPLPFFRLAAAVNDGDECIVIGSQGNGPAWWVRSGIVSQQFDFPNDLSQFAAGASSERPTLDRNRVTVIVTDTRVSGGDSGGPLLNSNGELIGLTFATSANETSGSVGWHVALPHVRAFIANLPANPEGVPFDSWTAGLGEGVAFESQMLDTDRDGRVDSASYLFAQPSESGQPRPVARTLFLDFAQRNTRSDSFAARVPSGLWGMDRRSGRFRFDVFLTTRADGLVAAGYTNSEGTVDEIRVGRDRSETATIIWRRSQSGTWTASRPATPAPVLDSARLTPAGLARLQALTGGDQVVAPASPRRGGAPGAPAPPPAGRGPNKLEATP